MNKELTLHEAALAWAQGKRVEAAPKHHPNNWGEVDGVGKERDRNKYNANIFHNPVTPYIFRLAPEPPAKRFRPWAPEEVPVGAEIRANGLKWRGLILGVNAQGQIEHFVGRTDLGYACENHEYSTDQGRTWLPCGVEVES